MEGARAMTAEDPLLHRKTDCGDLKKNAGNLPTGAENRDLHK
jgi:hypothetical protein